MEEVEGEGEGIKGEYLKEICKLLQECMDISLIDFILQLLQKSCVTQ